MFVRKIGVFSLAVATAVSTMSIATVSPQEEENIPPSMVAELDPPVLDDPAFALRVSDTFTSSDGQSGQYHLINDHVDPLEPAGMIVQLHGDGAAEFGNFTQGVEGKLSRVQAVAREQNMVLLAARTPSHDEGDPTWWRGGGLAKSNYLAELINAVGYGGNNIDRSQVWFTGYSGGAEQLSYHFLAQHLDLVDGGGALLVGGGGNGVVSNASSHLPENFRLHWLTGSEDVTGEFCGYCAAERGQLHYLNQGFAGTSIEILPGYDHYELQLVEADYLSYLISQSRTV
ncbi:hypothetical protein COCCU_06885 [Corynebacterium occultum]|uniref:Alpha/beta hydrolase family protein n=1 Tax=Corynebacterium occultum TaxID=2675219 RepID=A0A6B8VP21_9CORY|nr:hypothetical protein [Corynebacterium occultum]QGU07312.1 hypothetical protein COCCU_06885 [Corynebacterium occultum]